MKMEMNKNRAIKKQNSFWSEILKGHSSLRWLDLRSLEVILHESCCRGHAPKSNESRSNESRSSDVAISGCLLEIEVNGCRSLGKSISLYLSEVKYRSKWGQIRSIFDKLVRLSKFSPWTKIKIQGTKSSYCHASMTFSLFFGCARC